jgi:hypothetical protein
MAQPIWTDNQIEILKQYYSHTKTDKLIELLGDKTHDQIRWKAKTFKLRKKVSGSKKDISFFEDLNIPEHCYWWGFFLADGCYNTNSIIMSIHIRDIEHLQLFANKINSKISKIYRKNDYNPEGYYMARVAVEDRFILPRLATRFCLKPRKTYNPFNISEFLSKNRLLYFLTGIIDGDGYISKSGTSISIKCHSCWFPKFTQIQNALEDIFQIKSKVWICKQGWTNFCISRKRYCCFIKANMNEKNIPIMSRKWDRISNECKKEHTIC